MYREWVGRFQNRVHERGGTPRERNYANAQRTFDKYFAETLNRETALLNHQDEIEVVFQDHNQSNNQELSDDKYIVIPHKYPVNIGDYLTWRDDDWLVFTKEYKTINTHQQAKVKEVNQTIRWICKETNKIVNDGKGYGVYVQSQTLYTMGVSETTHLHAVDAKMIMYAQNNADTSRISMNQRIVIGSHVFKVKFIDDVSRDGLISYLLDQDTIGDLDNTELGVADYYRYYPRDDKDLNTPQDNEDSQEVLTPFKIKGDNVIRLSGMGIYTIESEDEVVIDDWVIETLEGEIAQVVEATNDRLTLQIPNDRRNVGKQFSIIATTSDGRVATKLITVGSRF